MGRLKDSSDLIYIGCTTKGKRTIRDRLKDHLVVRRLERNTGYRLLRVQQEVCPLEVSWKAFESHTDAKEHERTLLERYEKSHIEFPPLNRQEAGKKVRQTEELLDAVTQGQGRKVLKEVLARKEQC